MTKILIIEDEIPLRQEVLDWLTLDGFEALGAEDGVAGVEAAFLHLPDLIVGSIITPRLDSYGVLLELHSNPLTSGIPFIFVTPQATHDDFRKGMASGADDYITKPFTRAQLIEAIRARLQKKTAYEEARQSEINQLREALTLEREQRMVKAQMVAMFSHDFRNPLTTILSSNGLLRDYADRMDEQRKYLHRNRIDASVQRLIQMLDDMLLVMKMDTGILDFKPTSFSPEKLFQGIVDEFQSIYVETHRVIFESHFPDFMLADSTLFRSIAANLISNAIKYSPRGSEVLITLESRDEQLLLTVKDHGMGIPEADQERLFSAFQRGSNVGAVTGTGLGLAIVKQAVDLHGGSITFESHVGTGTTMNVAIPIRTASESDSQQIAV